ncbi:MAG: adenine phosphoribosyltransferase [Bacilli bacterium]|nr:adenine phosphoribosyltransferase [Bacilli bacterium]
MNYKDYIRVQEDFPKKGISFKDISPLLANGEAFSQAIAELKEVCAKWNPDVIIGPEARGFVVGAPLAQAMGKGFIMARKKGKLPGEIIAKTYGLEYGTDTIEVPTFAVKKGTRVVIADDLLATGGTLAAIESMLKELGVEVVGIVTLIELTDLQGTKLLSSPYFSLVQYPH